MNRKPRYCVECGGPVIIARENDFYTATEPVCSRCGLVHDFDVKEFLDDLIMVARATMGHGILKKPSWPRMKSRRERPSASHAPRFF